MSRLDDRTYLCGHKHFRLVTAPRRPDRCGKCRLAAGEKICQACGAMLPLSEFGKHSSSADGLRMECRPCNTAAAREFYFKQKYGLSQSDRHALLADGCDICGREAEHIDHCHSTGVVRGGLCGPCNRGLGLFGDDPERLRAAAEYLGGD